MDILHLKALGGKRGDSPIEIDSLLGELPIAMVRVSEGFVLHHLHTFSSVALLMAVLANHVQLPDLVLQNTHRSSAPLWTQRPPFQS